MHVDIRENYTTTTRTSIAVTIPSDSESEDDDFDSREPTDAELVKYHEQEQLRKLFIGNLS